MTYFTRHEILQKYPIKKHLDTIISIVDTLPASEKEREATVDLARKIRMFIVILEKGDLELKDYLADQKLSYPE